MRIEHVEPFLLAFARQQALASIKSHPYHLAALNCALLVITLALACALVASRISYQSVLRTAEQSSADLVTVTSERDLSHQAVVDLREKLDATEAELHDALTEIDLHIRDSDAIRTQLDETCAQLDEARTQVAAESAMARVMSCKADVLVEKNTKLERSLMSANAAAAVAIEDMGTMATERDATRAELDTAREERDDTRAELFAEREASHTVVTSLRGELADANDRAFANQIEVVDSRNKLAAARDETDALRNAAADDRKEVARLRDVESDLRYEVFTAQTAAAISDEAQCKTTAELSNLRCDMEEARRTHQKAQDTIAALTVHRRVEAEGRKQAEKKLASTTAELDRILKQAKAADPEACMQLYSSRSDLIEELREKEQKLFGLTPIYSQMIESEARARHEGMELKRQLEDIQQQYDTLRDSHKDYVSKHASTPHEVDELRSKTAKLDVVEDELRRCVVQRDALESDLASTKEKHERAFAEYKELAKKDELAFLRDHNALIAERDRLQTEAYDLSEDKKELAATVAALRSEISVLQDKVVSSEAACEAAIRQATERDAQVVELSKQAFSSSTQPSQRSRYPLTPASSFESILTPPATPESVLSAYSSDSDIALPSPSGFEDECSLFSSVFTFTTSERTASSTPTAPQPLLNGQSRLPRFTNTPRPAIPMPVLNDSANGPSPSAPRSSTGAFSQRRGLQNKPVSQLTGETDSRASGSPISRRTPRTLSQIRPSPSPLASKTNPPKFASAARSKVKTEPTR